MRVSFALYPHNIYSKFIFACICDSEKMLKKVKIGLGCAYTYYETCWYGSIFLSGKMSKLSFVGFDWFCIMRLRL